MRLVQSYPRKATRVSNQRGTTRRPNLTVPVSLQIVGCFKPCFAHHLKTNFVPFSCSSSVCPLNLFLFSVSPLSPMPLSPRLPHPRVSPRPTSVFPTVSGRVTARTIGKSFPPSRRSQTASQHPSLPTPPPPGIACPSDLTPDLLCPAIDRSNHRHAFRSICLFPESLLTP